MQPMSQPTHTTGRCDPHTPWPYAEQLHPTVRAWQANSRCDSPLQAAWPCWSTRRLSRTLSAQQDCGVLQQSIATARQLFQTSARSERRSF
eukprot:2721259-Prymnesium_polylepis.1